MTRARDVANVLSTATALATDTETAAAISTHNSATTSVHGISNTATLATQTYADSAVSTHAAAADPHTVYLKESEYWVAGKNKIINGDFSVWQRGTSVSVPSSGSEIYIADRFFSNRNGTGSTVTASQQTFTPGNTISGYEPKFFYRWNCSVAGSGATYTNILNTRIEDVRTFAGQTVTFSFWAKADSARKLDVGYGQYFGSGGSATFYNTVNQFNLTTSWTRYSVTFTVASITGKTIVESGTNGLEIYMQRPGDQLNTTAIFDIWGIQLEAGSTVTPFTTATGNPQAELAACQRYYWRSTPGSAYSTYANGMATSSTTSYSHMHFPVPMRISPTSVDYANVGFGDFQVGVINPSFVGLTSHTGTYGIVVQVNATGYTQYRPGQIMNNNNAAGYLGFSAEV